MSVQTFDPAKTRIIRRAHEVFLAEGYSAPTMSRLAQACELTRRALYNHFSNKEEVFRACIRHGNTMALEAGDAAAHKTLAAGGSALDVLTAWLDARFGETRRQIATSAHGRELNEIAFRLATDLMIEVSHESNRMLAQLVQELETRNLLTLQAGIAADKAGRLLGDGARGVNQARPPIPASLIAQHYRDITEAILFGCAARP